MVIPAEAFRGNIGRYFEGPDPRTGGVGTVVGGLDHTKSRDLGKFQVHCYPDETGTRRGSSVRGAFTGIGQQLSPERSLVLFTRPSDEEIIRAWAYFPLRGALLGVGFENELSPDQVGAAVDYSANPLVFTEVSIFAGITEAQAQQLAEARERHAELDRRFEASCADLREAERAAWAKVPTVFIR